MDNSQTVRSISRLKSFMDVIGGIIVLNKFDISNAESFTAVFLFGIDIIIKI